MFLGHDKMEPTFWPKWKQSFLRVVHVLILILKHIAHPLHLNCHPHFPLSIVVHGIYTSLQTFKDSGAIQISPIQPARKQSSSITSYCSDCIFCGPRIATKQCSNAVFLCNSHILLKQVWSSSCSCNHAPADTCPIAAILHLCWAPASHGQDSILAQAGLWEVPGIYSSNPCGLSEGQPFSPLPKFGTIPRLGWVPSVSHLAPTTLPRVLGGRLQPFSTSGGSISFPPQVAPLAGVQVGMGPQLPLE